MSDSLKAPLTCDEWWNTDEANEIAEGGDQYALADAAWDASQQAAAAEVNLLRAENEQLKAAIRSHRDQRGDDRCWQDDETLYSRLPEGYAVPARDTTVELALCEKYIACRRNPATEYVSPQRRIEELEASRANLLRQVQALQTLNLKLEDEERELRKATQAFINTLYADACCALMWASPQDKDAKPSDLERAVHELIEEIRRVRSHMQQMVSGLRSNLLSVASRIGVARRPMDIKSELESLWASYNSWGDKSAETERDHLRKVVLELATAIRDAHDSIFLQTFSNPIRNFRGDEVNVTLFNEANDKAGAALSSLTKSGG